MTKHTPGPWLHKGREVLYPDGERLAICSERPNFRSVESAQVVEANARLIAAAPKMLEALKRLCVACEKSLPSTVDGDEDAAMDFAQAIIAEIEGRS